MSREEIAKLEKRIAALKAKRDGLIKKGDFDRKELERILAFRTPKRTICQLLRELHDVLDGEEREKVESCLLIAKKMDRRLREYAGARYTDTWYNDKGEFIR